jgi:hypothetical protein
MNKKISVIYTVTQTYCAFLNEEDVINTNGVVDEEYIEDNMNQLIGYGDISAVSSSSHVIWEYVNGTER